MKTIGTILFAVALILIAKKLFKGSQDDEETPFAKGENRDVSEKDLIRAFNTVKDEFGAEIATTAEQLYRKETRHFQSGQFLKTLSPGMEVATGKKEFPYGWGSLTKFIQAYPQYDGGFYTYTMNENGTGKEKTFIGFPTIDGAVMFLAYTISKRKHAGYWRSTKTEIADKYLTSLKTINPKFT